MGGSAVSDRWQFHVPFSVRMILLEQSASKSRSLSFCLHPPPPLSLSMSLSHSSLSPPFSYSRVSLPSSLGLSLLHEALSHANYDSFVIAWELSKVPSLLIKSGTLQKFIRGLFRLCGIFSRLKIEFTKWRQRISDTDVFTFCTKREHHFK